MEADVDVQTSAIPTEHYQLIGDTSWVWTVSIYLGLLCNQQ